MTGAPIGTLQTLRAFAWSGWLRLLRAQQMATAVRAERKGGATVRSTSRRRGGMGLTLLFVLFVPLMGLNALLFSASATSRLASAVEHEQATRQLPTGEAVDGRRFQSGRSRPDGDIRFALLADARPDQSPATRARFAAAAGLLLGIMVVALVANSLGSTNLELGRADWSFPWLFSFPAPTRAIVLAKIAESTIVQALPWFFFFPATWQFVRALGWHGPAWLLAAAATLLVCLAVGSLRFLMETWLRLHLPVQRIRSVQGVATLVGLAGFTGVVWIAQGEPPAWFFALADATSAIVAWSPVSWPLAVARGELVGGPLAALALLAVPALATIACARLLRSGLDRGGNSSVRRPAAASTAFAPLGILRKELLLLGRDRNFLTQTLLAPLLVLVLQLVLQQDGRGASGVSVVTCYFLSVMAVSTGGFLVLSSEGKALWLTLSQPGDLAAMLARKVRLWTTVGILIACGAFVGLSLGASRAIDGAFLFDVLCLGVGAHGAARLAASIGVLSVDATADTIPRMPGGRHIYLYVFLAGAYAAGLASDEIARRLAAMLVFSTLAWSLWQRASDRLRWLLDTSGMPTSHLSAYDAGAAVTTFLLLQSLLLLILRAKGLAAFAAPAAFAGAGAATLLVWCLVLARRGVEVRDVLGFDGASATAKGRGVAAGLLLGAGLGAAALAWLPVAVELGWAESAPRPASGHLLAFAVLAVVAAPLVEEPLFRGLLLRAIGRSTTPLVAAAWSAALFAVLHPLAGWPPVFALGLATAFLRQRTNWLPACIAAHAAYNAVVTFGAMA